MTIRAGIAVAVASALPLVIAPLGADAQSIDDPVDLGSIAIVLGDRPTQQVDEAGSGEEFGIRLPPGASCPGDSANDQWRVQTFIVPASEDPASLTYDAVGPVGDGLWALYGTDTNPLVHGLTARNSGPGEPGLITGLPSISFAVFPPGTLPDGTYRIGVACTHFRETASYWDTEIEIESSADDEPAGFVWKVLDQSSASGASSQDAGGSNWAILAVVAVLAIAAGGFALTKRRRARQTTAHAIVKEQS